MLGARTKVFLALAAFLALLVYLGSFTSADSYPQYSSLRADEKGTKLLFTALQHTGAVALSRNYIPFPALQLHHASLLILGLPPEQLMNLTSKTLADLERLARDGNEITIATSDAAVKWEKLDLKKLPVVQRWGVSILANSSPLRFQPRGDWHEEAAGLLSKRMGKGKLILLSSADRLQNVKVASEGVPDYTTTLFGNMPQIVFDETHLGIEESGSVAGLARRYRLQGLLLGVLILAGCFVWHRAAAAELAPKPSTVGKVQPKDVLTSLVRTNLNGSQLIDACTGEWNRMHPDKQLDASAIRHLPPVDAYRHLQEQLNTGRKTYL
jgi:hypothetical protein